MPVTGHPRWLEESLLSLAGQSRVPDCVTILDDGIHDRDHVEALGTSLFGRSFRVFRSPGRGISAALNKGVRRSSCAWITRMDADDVAHPDRFQRQLDYLAAAALPA